MAIYSYAAGVRDDVIRNINSRMAMGDFMGAPSYKALEKKTAPRGVRGRGLNTRNLLMAVGGIGSYNAELCIPQMFLTPRGTDPDAQATIITVEGLQRAINKVGGKVEVNGLLTPSTVAMLSKVSGASWMSKTWLQIYGDFAEMMKRGMSLAPKTAGGHSAVGADLLDPFKAVPVAMFVGGAALLFWALK